MQLPSSRREECADIFCYAQRIWERLDVMSRTRFSEFRNATSHGKLWRFLLIR